MLLCPIKGIPLSLLDSGSESPPLPLPEPQEVPKHGTVPNTCLLALCQGDCVVSSIHPSIRMLFPHTPIFPERGELGFPPWMPTELRTFLQGWGRGPSSTPGPCVCVSEGCASSCPRRLLCLLEPPVVFTYLPPHLQLSLEREHQPNLGAESGDTVLRDSAIILTGLDAKPSPPSPM